MKQLAQALLLAMGMASASTATAVDVDAYVRKDKFEDIKLSPKGDYFAATIPLEDRTVLAVVRRADNKVTATFTMGKNSHIDGFTWVNDERVVMGIAEKLGSLDQPQSLGEIYAMNAESSQPELMAGQRVTTSTGTGAGSKIQAKKVEQAWTYLVDDLPNDDRAVLISVVPFASDPYTRVEKMDVYTGRRVPVTRAPVRNARFLTDNNGVVRFALGAGFDNVSKLYYRHDEQAEWQQIGDEEKDGIVELPLGFSADNRTAYFLSERPAGPDAIVAFDTERRSRTELVRDDNVDPSGLIYRNGTLVPVGAWFMDGKPRKTFFDDASAEAKMHRMLDEAFPDEAVSVTSMTRDGALALVRTSSDRNPGDFYLFDTTTKKADYLLSRADWIDPTKMATMRPIRLVARDGLELHGYLTVPNSPATGRQPLIVMPHGGPFGIQDTWGFDSEAQLLADAGYAVLQLNFRGSGGYGRAFKQAGARQWGGTMQDDLTDATRWAVNEGLADASRICIYGGSYGGYASLMGLVKEPDLYRCAVGYVGVYDLPAMQSEDSRQSRRIGNWSAEWVGDRAALAAVSPNRLAARIKAPVFLAAGGEDDVAPIEHTKMMEKALRAAGVPVETLYFDTEGHGFYLEKNRREYYTRLLDFFSRHLGGRTASTAGSTASASASAK